MSNLINMELVEALNPLYAFPIVAVILCAFFVYTFGFKSPVQPPSFDDIEEERKITKKRKTKETSKNKVVQNGKLNGTASNKAQAAHSAKKKDVEKAAPAAEKPAVEKSVSSDKPVTEKKSNKKSKQTNEKKAIQESKKESFSPEDAGGGWVQLVSKKGRKNRKKDEVGAVETQPPADQQIKSSQTKKLDEIAAPEAMESALESLKSALEESVSKKVTENPLPQRKTPQSTVPEKKEVENSSPEKKTENTLPEKKNTANSSKKKATENSVNEKKVALKEDKNNANLSIENNKDKIIIEDSKVETSTLEKVVSKENTITSGKLSGEASNKSKKKKKKNVEVISSNNNNNINNNNTLNRDESPVEQVISELPAPQNINNTINANIKTPIISETAPEVITDKVENTQQESKSSNVVFDELAELLPEKKEQRKKKKVRKDH